MYMVLQYLKLVNNIEKSFYTFLTVTPLAFKISFALELSSLVNKQTSTSSEYSECSNGLKSRRQS